MATLSTSQRRFGAFLIVFAVLSLSVFTASAQKLKLSVRSGVSFANYIGHNDSGPEGSAWSIPSGFYTTSITPLPSGVQYEYPNPYYKTSFTKDMRTGFYAGVFLDIKLKNRLSLEPGISYVQKGIDLKFSSTTQTMTSSGTYTFVRSIHTNYISIPVVVKYHLDRKEHFYVVGGIYDAFAIKTQIKDASTTASLVAMNDSGLPTYAITTSQITSIKTHVLDCGFVGGVGFSLPVSNRMSVGLDARANVGIVNVNGDSTQKNYLNFSSSTKNINIETGLRVGYTL